VDASEHQVMTGHDDVAKMARAMEAARRCEIVADTTQVLDADWGKIHNPWEHARPHQVKRWGEGPYGGLAFVVRIYLCELESSSLVYSLF